MEMVSLRVKIDEAAIFFFYGCLAIYIFIVIWRSIFKYRVYGLSLNLLIGNEIAVLAVIIYSAFYLRGIQIQANESSTDD